MKEKSTQIIISTSGNNSKKKEEHTGEKGDVAAADGESVFNCRISCRIVNSAPAEKYLAFEEAAGIVLSEI